MGEAKKDRPLDPARLKEKLIKIGAKVVSGGRSVRFQMTEVAILRHVFAQILRNIAKLRAPPLWADLPEVIKRIRSRR